MYIFIACNNFKVLNKKWGGGGGVTLIFLKLDFEIAVDQQTRAVTELLRGF